MPPSRPSSVLATVVRATGTPITSQDSGLRLCSAAMCKLGGICNRFSAWLLSLPPFLHCSSERERGDWGEGGREWRSLLHLTSLPLPSRVDFWATGGRIRKLFKLLPKSKSSQDN